MVKNIDIYNRGALVRGSFSPRAYAVEAEPPSPKQREEGAVQRCADMRE